MRWIREGWGRLRSLFRAAALERGLDEEIQFHIEQQMAKNLRAGMTPHEARRQAYIKFGGTERIKESTRDEFRPAHALDLLLDFRYAVRALRRAPSFTLVAVLTLALGIGATTAVFTVVHGVLIKPLPFHDADAIVSMKHTSKEMKGEPHVGISLSLFLSYARESRSFEHVGVWSRGAAHVTQGIDPEEVITLNVTAGTLRALGIQPAMGRWFAEADQAPGSIETVILMDGYWRSRFGGDPAVIGRQVSIDARPRVVIGVMPASFRFLDETPELMLPVRVDPAALTLGGFNFEALGRLKPGVTVEHALADLTRIVPLWVEAWPSFPGLSRDSFRYVEPLVWPLKQELVGNVGNMLWVLMGTIGIVLAIACANVANLVLVRAQDRHHEFAIRAALGAGRGRLARQVLVESLVLGLLGGAAGLLLASFGLHALSTIGPAASIPRLQEITLDPVVLVFTLGLSLLSALLFGSIPVAKFGGRRLALMLRSGGRGSSDSQERHRARNGLVVVQVALALILLVGSGLMVRTFLALRAVPPGFSDPDHVQLARMTISEGQIANLDRVLRLQHDMVERLAEIPGVTHVSFMGNVPMTGERSRSTIVREDAPVGENDMLLPLRLYKFVAPGYFQTIGTRLVVGRDFTWNDIEDHQPVAVISENLARELWSDPRAALGKRIREGSGSPWREVIGVVGDVYDEGVHRQAPTIVYWPPLMEIFQGKPFVRRTVTFAIRTNRAGSESFLTQVRDAVSSVKADVPLTRVRTLGDVYGRSMAATSFALVMLVIAAAMALLLGIVGIYGVIAYAVTQRRREIGIRAALGATRRELEAMFVRHGVMLALAGVACGLAAAATLSRLMASLLFGTSPLDPMIYVLVSLGLATVAALASYLPARRATLVDPVRTLRGD